ncbi:hypothetical protein [Nostoc sp. 'Peltigera membranacea cyanobiont' N6]|uniref:hypothetical protein n=1 Tax=Nostoc sp. 'Peltigera membranacea cyanobiont' N6 TaxID=1261031 RepID=UPI000CF35606|nr:hypothetical protein [Nostoc sp. 'Peltigera membranacea cyanobiont' N6]AVH68518.1 hypothetical protein NPM_60002 [Nostoc sp. 'Peltigera membranacea cyanobiont' N6]
MASAELTSLESIQAVPTVETPSDEEQVNVDTPTSTEIESTAAIFQAVGVITGSINFSSDGQSTVTIGSYEYPLYYSKRQWDVLNALKKEIENTGNQNQRLVVYPKAIHFPRKEQPHRIAFQLVGFDRGRKLDAVSGELEDLEFKLSGLWQFIPVCSTPCISVFRNFSDERLEFIKQSEPARKVKFMKASHIPLLWKDAPVRPFRFNPKVAKEDQGRAAFVTIKAKFLPGRDVFGFVALTALPQEAAPRYLKASKEDKATVQLAAKKDKPKVQRPSKKHNLGSSNPPLKPILKKKSPLVEGEADNQV